MKKNGWGWMRMDLSEVSVTWEWSGFPGSIPMHPEALQRLTAVCVTTCK